MATQVMFVACFTIVGLHGRASALAIRAAAGCRRLPARGPAGHRTRDGNERVRSDALESEDVMRASNLLLATLFIAGAAAAARAADALPCADYISTTINDKPLTGHLTGTETRTWTFGANTKVEPGGVGGGVQSSYTVTWEVGYYSMSDGSVIAVDCRNYTKV